MCLNSWGKPYTVPPILDPPFINIVSTSIDRHAAATNSIIHAIDKTDRNRLSKPLDPFSLFFSYVRTPNSKE